MSDESTGLAKVLAVAVLGGVASAMVSSRVGRLYGYRVKPKHAFVMGVAGGLARSAAVGAAGMVLDG